MLILPDGKRETLRQQIDAMLCTTLDGLVSAATRQQITDRILAFVATHGFDTKREGVSNAFAIALQTGLAEAAENLAGQITTIPTLPEADQASSYQIAASLLSTLEKLARITRLAMNEAPRC